MAAKKKEAAGQYGLEEYGLTRVEVRLRLEEAGKVYSVNPVSSPEVAAGIMRQEMSKLDREYLCVVNLDTRMRALNFNVVSIGTINKTVAQASQIFKSAILSNAAGIMLFHNHPSGSIEPSAQDISMTRQITELGGMMGIPVIDHMIVGAGVNNYYSFREAHPEIFTQYDKGRVEESGRSEETGVSDDIGKYLRDNDKPLPERINNFLYQADRIIYDNEFMGKTDGLHQIEDKLQQDPGWVVHWLKNHVPPAEPLIGEILQAEKEKKMSKDTEQKEKQEITIKFAKGLLGEPFKAQDGNTYVTVKIPNNSEQDHSPWASFVLKDNHVHEDRFGKGVWAKLPAEGHTTINKPRLAGQENGHNRYEDVKTQISNTDLKKMVESYKTRDRTSVLGKLHENTARVDKEPPERANTQERNAERA